MILIQWKFYLKIKRIHGVYFRAFSNRKNFKRFICEKQSENPIAPKIHNLILLSQKANLEVPKEIREKIQIINTFNISARYDDYKKVFQKNVQMNILLSKWKILRRYKNGWKNNK